MFNKEKHTHIIKLWRGVHIEVDREKMIATVEGDIEKAYPLIKKSFKRYYKRDMQESDIDAFSELVIKTALEEHGYGPYIELLMNPYSPESLKMRTILRW